MIINKLYKTILALFCLGSLSMVSCSPEADFELPKIKKQLVVDGWIELDGYAHVILTYNTGYFENLDSASFRALVARFAKVMISDGDRSEILTLTRDTNYFPPYVYKGNLIKGELNKTYHLLVDDEIGIVKASTQIPPPVALDSIWFTFLPDNDTLGYIQGIFKDNALEKNYYRTFTKVGMKGRKYIPTLLSIFNDTYFNGEFFTFSLKKGTESYLKPIEDIYFQEGDTVLVRITAINENSYNFWLSYDEEVINSGNPFAANHSKIISNIENGLGIWCGYGSSYYFLEAKH